jgi:hypothetical protein
MGRGSRAFGREDQQQLDQPRLPDQERRLFSSRSSSHRSIASGNTLARHRLPAALPLGVPVTPDRLLAGIGIAAGSGGVARAAAVDVLA